ncbi:MAG: hypothetical protein JW830_03100 [Bacteroidales bacterium]|nr:hypothetical protein [Bacteroidales bacterium]
MDTALYNRLNRETMPVAVVLGIDFSGYGIVRSLVPYKIPVVAFSSTTKFIPESKTRLCAVIPYHSDEELMLGLQAFAGFRLKPVLIATMDSYVSLIMKNRARLEEIFHLNYPPNEVLDLLLSKSLFNEFAGHHQVLIPRSINVQNTEQLNEIVPKFEFPVILKPYIRRPHWQAAGLPKAFLCDNEIRLRDAFSQAVLVEDQLIVQEWVPGGDSEIYYCLVYFDEQGCLGAFSGQKIRQWPVGTGSTASTRPADDSFLSTETVRILSLAGFRGFGSIEYKKHTGNGKYYLIEPTAGRLNQQEYVATLNGVNIPLLAYGSMTGMNLVQDQKPDEHIVYIDEAAELLSALVHLKRGLLTPAQWLRSLQGKKRFRYYEPKDRIVFVFLLWKIIRLGFKTFVGKRKN